MLQTLKGLSPSNDLGSSLLSLAFTLDSRIFSHLPCLSMKFASNVPSYPSFHVGRWNSKLDPAFSSALPRWKHKELNYEDPYNHNSWPASPHDKCDLPTKFPWFGNKVKTQHPHIRRARCLQ